MSMIVKTHDNTLSSGTGIFQKSPTFTSAVKKQILKKAKNKVM